MAAGPSASASSPNSPKLMRAGVGAALFLVIVAGGAFYYAATLSRKAPSGAAGKAVGVAISEHSCDPNQLTVPAGVTTFQIANRSDRAVEWEILDGVMVVEERENIAPGLSENLTARLAPGDYKITCGLLSNPHGTLHVAPATDAAPASAHPSLMAFIGPLAEYKVYLARESAALVDTTDALAAAVKSGDLAKARSLYAPARVAYEHVAPVADAFSDLSTSIDAPADYFEKREQDPDFAGFHRIELGLFQQDTTENLSPFADRLVADVTELKQRIHDLQLSPSTFAANAAKFLGKIADAGTAGDEDRYAHTDLSDLNASMAGARKIFDLLRPLVAGTNADLATEIDGDFTSIAALFVPLRAPDGFVSYVTVSAADRKAITDAIRKLAADLDQLDTQLGLA